MKKIKCGSLRTGIYNGQESLKASWSGHQNNWQLHIVITIQFDFFIFSAVVVGDG